MAAVSARPTPRRRVLMFRCLHYSVDFSSPKVRLRMIQIVPGLCVRLRPHAPTVADRSAKPSFP